PSDNPGALSMGIYGESVARESGKGLDAYMAPGWKDGDISYSDTCRVLSFRDGQAPDGPSPAFSAGSPPAGIASNDCDGRTLRPDFTLKHWTDVYKKTGRDIMPSFIYMSLPQNHTLATTLGNPTPQSMVADNDYALGLLVEAVSTSVYWKDTAVFVVEDDAQDGPDHVDAHRSVALVISAYNRPGQLVHEYHSTVSLVRTMELLLGIPPLNQLDDAASPADIFRAEADMTPYRAVLPAVAPDNLIVPKARDAAEAYWMRRTAEQDFWRPDMADARTLNSAIWFSVRGESEPAPEPARLPAADAMRAEEENDECGMMSDE
ncbi:MAG TPA: hypothetical protein VE642_03040, partial [Pyrinomonadaceae bacterium]|nr:hypothetical protein [Pyrinomonadaceae bacterium]